MANQLNTLYPPQIATFMPAFARTQTTSTGVVATDAVVYYSLSPYNEVTSIKYIHVSVVDQKTNENALQNPNGVLIKKFDPANDYDENVGMYRFVIPNSSIRQDPQSDSDEPSPFKINQFYKVQLRFDLSNDFSADDTRPDNMTDTAEMGRYLIENRRNFSEWSSICLIRPIAEPEILLRNFDTSSSPRGYNKGIIPISGFLSFEDSSETETMAYYQLQVLDETAENVLMETDRIFTGMNFDQNDINYKLDVQELDTDSSSDFVLRVTVTTKNQYVTHKDYTFQIVDFIEDEFFSPKIKVELDNEDALAIIHVENVASVYGTLYVKRTSNKSDFKVWEDVYVTPVNGSIELDVCDNTICSMVWYRYSVQLENIKGGLSPVFMSDRIFPDFYDAVFSRGSTQLSVRYNYTVSSFKPTVNRTKVDTLGGKYPKFMENGAINYKQFTISGLISTQEDPGEKFMRYNDAIGGLNLNYYSIYKRTNGVTEYYDYLFEREFREKAMEWLNDGEPKLYRSQTEGNLCVILTDISLTPNKTLSRRIWDFSATAYEVAEGMSMADLHALGIYNIYADGKGGDGTLADGGVAELPPTSSTKPEVSDEIFKVGQMYSFNVTSPSTNFIEMVGDKLAKNYTGFMAERMPTSLYIKNVRVFFHGKPHMYLQESNNNLRRIDYETYSSLSAEDKQKVLLGYRFTLNGSSTDTEKQIFVNENGFYEVPSDVDVVSMFFPDARDGSVPADELGKPYYMDGFRPEYVTVEFVVVYRETNAQETVVSNSYVEKRVVGQITDKYEPGEYLNSKINSKYSFSEPGEYSRRLISWKGLSVDVTPFAVFKVKYTGEDAYTTYEVGHSGVLRFDEKYTMSDLCFVGVRMTQCAVERAPYLEPWEFVLMGDYDDTRPVNNGVYSIDGQSKVFYQGAWHDFELSSDGTGIASVPVEGSINYIGDVLISEF